ncbi:MAG TPA: EAL domain-containing protein, partial [Gammaproteobacteria bacterium]
NRSLFRDRMSQHVSMARIHKHSISLLLIDLDNFKNINETLGHEHGDQLLKQIAQRFLQKLNADETLSRLGGDEFVLILPTLDDKQASQRASQFLELLNRPFNVADTEIVVGASMGISVYPEHGEDISTLLRHADQAMYIAKQQKRGVTVYNPDEDTSSLGLLTMTVDLRKAFEENQFELHYQPKITIENQQLAGVEALARWQHPERGFIPPTIFINSLEQNGLIDKFTYWVIETVLKQINNWEQAGYKIKIAINISTQSLVNPDFIDRIEELIPNEETGAKLMFEITENLFLSEYDRLSEILNRLRDRGIKLSIDDFGTGYSSLSRLRKLPVSELKIDRSFVMDMIRNPDDEVIVRSTIDLAHNLGLTVIAEGVENEMVLERLGELGCDIAQGYHISKPVPAEQLEKFIKNKYQ